MAWIKWLGAIALIAWFIHVEIFPVVVLILWLMYWTK
jgi:hypothetical protein